MKILTQQTYFDQIHSSLFTGSTPIFYGISIKKKVEGNKLDKKLI